MAGIPLGDNAPAASPSLSPAAGSPPRRPLLRVPAATRTRRHHGMFLLGSALAQVSSSRREADGHGVLVSVDGGTVHLAGRMTASQARALARSLVAAADAVEAKDAGRASA